MLITSRFFIENSLEAIFASTSSFEIRLPLLIVFMKYLMQLEIKPNFLVIGDNDT